MRQIESLIDNICHPMKLSVPRMGFIQLNCWLKSAMVTPNKPGWSESIGCSPQIDNKTLLMKTTPMQLLEYGEVKLVPT